MKKALSLILSLLMVISLFSGLSFTASAAQDELAAVGDYAYTDPTDPYVATDFDGLRQVFNRARASSLPFPKIYIKLGSDISYTGSLTLETDGSNIELDLNGYTLTCESDSDVLITTCRNSVVTICDSRRYDSSALEWISGAIDFHTSSTEKMTQVLGGSIVVESGTIINSTHSTGSQTHTAYLGTCLQMRGGVLEADCPIRFVRDDPDCVISGGTLRVKRYAGIEIYFGNARGTAVSRSKISKVRIINDSNSSQVYAIKGNFPDDYPDAHENWEMLKYFSSLFPSETQVYRDGALQTSVTEDTVFMGVRSIFGPTFSDDIVYAPATPIDDIDVSVYIPTAPGGHILYTASLGENAHCTVEDYDSTYWRNGVQWRCNGTYLNPNELHSFEVGKTYTVYISVVLSDDAYCFADRENLTATVNGNRADVTTPSADNYIVRYAFRIEPATVDRLDVTIPEPDVGNQITYTAAVPSGKGYAKSSFTSGLWKNGMLWYKDGSMLSPSQNTYFDDNMTYSVYVLLELADDTAYRFAAVADTTATVNGHAAEILDYGTYGYCVKYTFTIQSTIDTIEITVPEPEEGMLITYTASVPDGAGYEVEDFNTGKWQNGVKWDFEGEYLSPQDTNHFVIGNRYHVYVSLVLTDPSKQSFADPSEIKATINGYDACIEKCSSSNYVIFCDLYPDPAKIRTIDITIDEPQAGSLISYSASVPSDSGCCVENYNSYSWKNGLLWSDGSGSIDPTASRRFIGGETYLLTVSLILADSYHEFIDPDDTVATVNGQPAQVSRYTADNYLVRCYFTIPNSRLLGDVDGSGKVDIVDATFIQRYATEIKTPYDTDIELYGDVDSNGKADIVDATFVQRFATEIKTPFPIGDPI